MKGAAVKKVIISIGERREDKQDISHHYMQKFRLKLE